MRTWTKIIVVSIVLLLTAPFAFDIITVSSLTWADIQRYGGLKIGVPLDTDKGFYLPIICNVSGTDSITIRPTAISSANVCKRTKVQMKDNNIFINVKVSMPFFDDETCICKAVRLGQMDHGHYKVFYDSGEYIGEFDI